MKWANNAFIVIRVEVLINEYNEKKAKECESGKKVE